MLKKIYLKFGRNQGKHRDRKEIAKKHFKIVQITNYTVNTF